jgi:hypothetical protein
MLHKLLAIAAWASMAFMPTQLSHPFRREPRLQQRLEGFANETSLSQFSGLSKMRRLRLGELVCYLIGAIILSYW